MPVLKNISSLVTPPPPSAEAEATDLRRIENAALVWADDTIEWVGSEADLPGEHAEMSVHDAEGTLVIPGLVDCHTHLAFAGWRDDEFARMVAGPGTPQITRGDGGILQTVRETRAASETTLYDRCSSFLRDMATLGVTTVEAKSGYGLTVDDELKQLRVYQRLQEEHPLRVVPTVLGAHAVPPEYESDRTGYLELLHVDLIPRVAQTKLAEFCDVLVQAGAFHPGEAKRLLRTARQHGLTPKLHVDQRSDTGGAAIAAEVGAVSADHLEHASPTGITAMADAGVVAVSLPFATLYLDEDPLPVSAFQEAGVPIAIGTDFNPVTAPSYHLPLAMMLACTRLRMTPAQVLTGATRHAAAALDRANQVGSLAPGKQADFVLLDVPSLSHWLYHFRPNAAVATYVQGRRWPP